MGAKEWGEWFRQHSKHLGHGNKIRASLVDFAENQLTSKGAGSLLQTFAACGIPVHVLKLHHNIIKDAGGFAEYLRTCEGCLQELHLSHNSLDAKASAAIVAAAASAKGEDGVPCYPRRSGARGFVPLWLRLEKNNIDDGEFSAIMDVTMPDKLCSARSKWCTPHCCAAKVPPAVHAKNLGNQRGSQTDLPHQEDSGGDFFRKLLAKSAQNEYKVADPDSGSGTMSIPEGWERAEIERWDWDEGRWVRDVIDIPPQIEPRSSLPKAQQQKLTMGLKALIGIGQRLDGDMEALPGIESGGVTPAVSSKPGALKLRSRGAGAGNVNSQAPNLMRLLREEGFKIGAVPASQGLNPQAPEFRPTQKATRPAKGQAKAKDGRARAAREVWNCFSNAASSAEDDLDLNSATKLMTARDRNEPMRVPVPAPIQFGCLDEVHDDPVAEAGVETKTTAWSVRKDSSNKEDDETQDASSGVDSASTADAVDTVDSTEDAMGPEMSKLETGKSSSCIA